MTWLTENLGTVLVSAVILLVLVAIVINEIRKRRKGKGGCSCGCGGCAMSELCHPKKEDKQTKDKE